MAKWFVMPEGVDSISLRQLEFHPKVVHDGVRYFSVPDHLTPELLSVHLRIGTDDLNRPVMARFVEVNRPEGEVDEPDVPEVTDAVVLNGQIMTLQVQMEGLRAQIAELTVERDDLRLRVEELEAEQPETMKELDKKRRDKQPQSGPRFADSPSAETLLTDLAGITLGKD